MRLLEKIVLREYINKWLAGFVRSRQFFCVPVPAPFYCEFIEILIVKIQLKKVRLNMAQRKDIHKILIIGSGPIIIGQACEFDYSGTQACKTLRNLGYEIVLANSNPATIMTDPGMADHTYIEPLTVPSLEKIIVSEKPDALLPNLGGQSGLNLWSELAAAGVLD